MPGKTTISTPLPGGGYIFTTTGDGQEAGFTLEKCAAQGIGPNTCRLLMEQEASGVANAPDRHCFFLSGGWATDYPDEAELCGNAYHDFVAGRPYTIPTCGPSCGGRQLAAIRDIQVNPSPLLPVGVGLGGVAEKSAVNRATEAYYATPGQINVRCTIQEGCGAQPAGERTEQIAPAPVKTPKIGKIALVIGFAVLLFWGLK